MEGSEFGSSTQSPANPSTSVATSVPRTSPRKTPVSPKRSAKRTSPKSGVAAGKDPIYASRSTLKSTPKPLLPFTERRSQEDKSLSRTKKEDDAEKWEVAPDGSSAGREGRQFTVANVGNNGRIYLRYELQRIDDAPGFLYVCCPLQAQLSHNGGSGGKHVC